MNSRIQFMKPNMTTEYKQRFNDNIKFYFDVQKVLVNINFEFIHNAWTINFEDSS
jgi:hypothetical protein